MSGYGGVDDESLTAMIYVDNQVALCRLLIPSGESLQYCTECGGKIPEGRRLALSGVSKCISCQEIKDTKRPKIKVVTYIL